MVQIFLMVLRDSQLVIATSNTTLIMFKQDLIHPKTLPEEINV